MKAKSNSIIIKGLLFVVVVLLLCGVCKKRIILENTPELFGGEKNCLNSYFDMIVCICLPERKEHMKKTFKQWGLTKVEFFDAYLKKDYTHQDFINMNFLRPNYSDYLNLGRVCCHYSATAVYRKFLNSSAKNVLVFEDDLNKNTFNSKKEFNHATCPLIKSIPKDWDYLNFSKCHDLCSKTEEINNPYWSIPARPLCRTAIALNKKAARIILNETIPMSQEPGDKMIGALIRKKRFKAYATKDITFFQHREKFGSTLNNTAPTNPRKCQIENPMSFW